jgi:hypothetical protein
MKKERSKELFSPESCSPVLSGGIRDFTVHGTEPVPLHIYHQDYAHGGLSVPFHWHKELEWIWVEKGTLTLTLKTETRTISEGTFLFINSHELHQLCSIGTTPSVHHALVFLPEILSCAYLDSCEADWIRPLLSHQLLLPAFPLEELSAAAGAQRGAGHYHDPEPLRHHGNAGHGHWHHPDRGGFHQPAQRPVHGAGRAPFCQAAPGDSVHAGVPDR